MDRKEPSAPKILEIGEVSRMRHAFPETTRFFSTFVRDSEQNKAAGAELVSARNLFSLTRQLSDPALDLIVVHASPHGPLEGVVRTIFRRSALSGHLPILRNFTQQLLKRGARAPVAVLDLHDSPSIFACNLHLLETATLYFKRELPPDRWQLFTRAGKIPSRRQRERAYYRNALSRVRPISLGMPDSMLGYHHPEHLPENKDIDVFFAGRLKSSSTLRERGARELNRLSSEGLRVEIHEDRLSPSEYRDRCARAWLIWAPEGYGWDCFRTYEAALAGSVPLVSRQTIERHAPLIDGEHCIYYDVEPGQLAQTVRRVLQNKEQLSRMAKAARQHVLQHHTPQALAQYVVNSTLSAARQPNQNAACE